VREQAEVVSPYGKRFVGPCGHPHEFVVSQFAVCTVKGCSGAPRCPKCGTTKVEPFVAEGLPLGAMHCLPNGHCWWNPT
jgi:hypothetical protein